MLPKPSSDTGPLSVSNEGDRRYDGASTEVRRICRDDPERDVSALGSYHTRRSHHVHDRVYRSHEHLARLAANQQGPPFGSATGRNGRRYFLLGLPRAANPRGPSGEALERQEIHRHIAGCVGDLCGGLWPCTHLSRAVVSSFVAGNSREWCSSCEVNSSLSLVSPFRTRARQCILAALLACCGDSLLAFLRMDVGSLVVARDVGCRRLVPFLVARDLAQIYSRPSGGSVLVAGK